MLFSTALDQTKPPAPVWRSHSNGSASNVSVPCRVDSKLGATSAFLSKMLIAFALCAFSSFAGSTAVIAPASGGEPFKQPQIAMTRHLLAVTWGAGNTVYFAKSGDGGHTFTASVKVAEDGIISLGNHRGPRIVMTPEAIVISAIYGAKGRGADGDLIAWRSTDGGKSWSTGVHVNDRAAAAREGLHAMAADGNTVWAVWLDDRDGGKALWGASSKDGGATWSPNQRIYASPDGHICECCHPSVVVRNGGKDVYAMFRNWLGGSRDLYLAVSTDSGKTFKPQKLGEGTWHLNACPMDGGALIVDRQGPVSVWRRESTIFMARPGTPETTVGPGKNAAMAGRTIAWSTPEGLSVRYKDGQPAVVDAKGAFPSVASDGGRDAVAWEDNGQLSVLVFSR